MSCELKPLGRIAKGLHRPECVLVADDEGLIVSDSRGGVTRINHVGGTVHLPCPGETTNGVALDRDGTLYLAGIDTGTVHALQPDGSTRLILDQFDGYNLGAVNFVHFDSCGGLWVTVSTRTVPRSRAIEQPIPDGYLLKLSTTGPVLMAQGLCFANEIRFDADMRHLYLAESARGRVLRMPVLPDGSLGEPSPFGPNPLFTGAIVDGLAFDVEGALWVTEVTRNGIYRISRDGNACCLFEDPKGELIDFPASIAFGGPNRQTVFVGSIRTDYIFQFQCSVAGAPMWHQSALSSGDKQW